MAINSAQSTIRLVIPVIICFRASMIILTTNTAIDETTKSAITAKDNNDPALPSIK